MLPPNERKASLRCARIAWSARLLILGPLQIQRLLRRRGDHRGRAGQSVSADRAERHAALEHGGGARGGGSPPQAPAVGSPRNDAAQRRRASAAPAGIIGTGRSCTVWMISVLSIPRRYAEVIPRSACPSCRCMTSSGIPRGTSRQRERAGADPGRTSEESRRPGRRDATGYGSRRRRMAGRGRYRAGRRTMRRPAGSCGGRAKDRDGPRPSGPSRPRGADPPFPAQIETAPRCRSMSVSVSASASLIRRPARQSMMSTPRSLIPSGPSPAARITAMISSTSAGPADSDGPCSAARGPDGSRTALRATDAARRVPAELEIPWRPSSGRRSNPTIVWRKAVVSWDPWPARSARATGRRSGRSVGRWEARGSGLARGHEGVVSVCCRAPEAIARRRRGNLSRSADGTVAGRPRTRFMTLIVRLGSLIST